MASNFWTSTQYRLTQEYNAVKEGPIIDDPHEKEKTIITSEERKKLLIFYVDYIKELAKRTNLRQRVSATAGVYFHRFYRRRSFCDIEPFLLAGTALYLASKVEESPLRLSLLIEKMHTYANHFMYTYTQSDITNCEFYLLEALNCKLIVFHPYRGLIAYAKDAKLSSDDIECAWHLANDSYNTDLLLRYPPYKIALTCIFIASVVRKIDNIHSWFCQLSDQDLQSICQISADLQKNIDKCRSNRVRIGPSSTIQSKKVEIQLYMIYT
ncbi:cyclin-C-like [Schistocerca gregaria]|uniref:cyclin-C-like n=1 Tax=Schistocerca gregaria TaxID=7010 RepID=UPI00211E5A41|nr:cyclin-C-like [Schistocerca gregaria]